VSLAPGEVFWLRHREFRSRHEGHKHHLAANLPDSAPGTDGVAIFEGRVIGRVRHLTDLPRDPKPWSWSVTDPTLAGMPGWANTHGEMPSRRHAMARLIERWEELRRIGS